MNTFSIRHQLTLKDFQKLNYTLLYRKVWVILISIIAILFIIYNVILLFTKKYDVLDSDYHTIGIAAVAMAIWAPLFLLFIARRNYKSNYRLNELITYEFSDEGYTATGESFNSKVDWAKVYKVHIIQGWLILYHSRMVANMIKIEPNNEGNIEALKQLLKNGNLKAKLKW